MASERLAIYPGAFDPITNGHLDIIERSVNLFDRLYVAIAESSPKQTLFPLQERKRLVKECLKDYATKVEVTTFDGLLVKYARSIQANCIVRGLRVVTDYDYEVMMAHMNHRLAPEIETIFLSASEKCSFISSTMVKEVATLGGDVVSLVPTNVHQALKEMLKNKV